MNQPASRSLADPDPARYYGSGQGVRPASEAPEPGAFVLRPGGSWLDRPLPVRTAHPVSASMPGT